MLFIVSVVVVVVMDVLFLFKGLHERKNKTNERCISIHKRSLFESFHFLVVVVVVLVLPCSRSVFSRRALVYFPYLLPYHHSIHIHIHICKFPPSWCFVGVGVVVLKRKSSR